MIVTSKGGGSSDPTVLLHAYRPAIAVVAALAAIGFLVALAGALAYRPGTAGTRGAESRA